MNAAAYDFYDLWDHNEIKDAICCGSPVLFSDRFIDPETLPSGYTTYDLSKSNENSIRTLEPSIEEEKRYGSIICPEQLNLGSAGYRVLSKDDFTLTGDSLSKYQNPSDWEYDRIQEEAEYFYDNEEQENEYEA